MITLLPTCSASSRSSAAAIASRSGNLALRHQLAVYKKTVRPAKAAHQRPLFCLLLSRVWISWRRALVIVSPNTVLRWQRRRFRDYWTSLSHRRPAGRPPIGHQIRAFILRVAPANPLGGAPRIHGDL
jgi:putative transposase